MLHRVRLRVHAQAHARWCGTCLFLRASALLDLRLTQQFLSRAVHYRPRCFLWSPGWPITFQVDEDSVDWKCCISPTPQRGYSHRASTASSSNEDMLTPHDAALKRRLEGVLYQARDQDRGKSYRRISHPRAYTRESSEDWNVGSQPS